MIVLTATYLRPTPALNIPLYKMYLHYTCLKNGSPLDVDKISRHAKIELNLIGVSEPFIY
jgi:hypothetical protein